MAALRHSFRIAATTLALSATGCDRPALSALEAGFEVPELWPPYRQPRPATSVTIIDPATVPLIEAIQLVDGPPLELKTVSLGKPKVLLPKAKGTYYPAEHPLSERRAMVRRVREDKHGRVTETYEGYLVDFEDGVVETFDSISAYDQYSRAGVGFAWKIIDGVKTKVLVHADGLVVPMWPETEAAPDLLLHPAWGQAWIFGVDEHPTAWTDDDPDKTELRSVYIHWTDLRSPPPDGPKVVLPFSMRFDPRVITNEDDSVHGPRPKQQADAPFVLDGDLSGCNAVELDADGGFHCRYGSYKTLAEGWSVWAAEDAEMDSAVKFQNRETGEVQMIDAKSEGDDCAIRHVVMEPPRVLVACDSADHILIWSPEKTVAIEDSGGTTTRQSYDELLITGIEWRDEGPNPVRGWIDMELAVAARLPKTPEREVAASPYGGNWLFSENPPTALLTTRIGEVPHRPVPVGMQCRRGVGFADWHHDSILVACWGPPPNPQRLKGLDLGLSALFPLPGADNRESLITATHVLSTRGGQREVIAWQRGSLWPIASPE